MDSYVRFFFSILEKKWAKHAIFNGQKCDFCVIFVANFCFLTNFMIKLQLFYENLYFQASL